jgi:hypothetical protein
VETIVDQHWFQTQHLIQTQECTSSPGVGVKEVKRHGTASAAGKHSTAVQQNRKGLHYAQRYFAAQRCFTTKDITVEQSATGLKGPECRTHHAHPGVALEQLLKLHMHRLLHILQQLPDT